MRFFRKGGKAQPSGESDANVGVGLRTKMLMTSAADIGIQPTDRFPNVFGMLMDWPLDANVATIVSICDGNASLYTTATFGIIGGIGHEPVRNAASAFVSAAEKLYAAASPINDFPYPAAGRVRFYFLCFDGVRMIDADEASLKTGSDPCSGLWREGQNVMSALRMTMPPETAKG
jgi:hypothetical protein